MDSAVRQKTYIQISANGQVYHTFQVNYTLFSPDCTTLLPTNFLPPVGGNYAIEVKNAAGIAYIKQKWATYADGFEIGGALFRYGEVGGKKIRRGDSVSPGKQYYVVTEQIYSPYYPEIQVTRIGSIRLKSKKLIVGRLSISVSTKDVTRYKLVNSHLKQMFGVWILETSPELTTLWPPTVLQQDIQVLATLSTKKLYCAVSSGNDTPNIYYFETSTSASQPNQQTAVGDSVAFSFLGQELAAPVDRKYVGREAFYRRISFPSRNFFYEVNLEDSNGVRLDLENLTQTSLEGVSVVKANAKMELVVRCKGNLYQHVTIRADNIPMPSLKNPEEIYLVIEGGIFLSYHSNEPIMVAQLGEVYFLADLKKHRQGPMIPAPAWVAWIVKSCCQKGNLSLARFICDEISGGKIPLGVLKALLVVKKIMIVEGAK